MSDSSNPQPNDQPTPVESQPPVAPQYGPPVGQAPQYGAPQYDASQSPVPQQQGTNGLAITSLVAGLIGLVLIPLIPSIVAIITGHVAKKQIATRGGNGSGLATAGLITGYIGAVLAIIGVIAVIFLFIAIANDPSLQQQWDFETTTALLASL